VPQRTCIACRQIAGKRGLVRLVRTEVDVIVDPSGKMPGRGAYIHPSRECWAAALSGNRIQQALRTKLSEENRQTLADYMVNFPASEQVSPEEEDTDLG
jgi:uncharacterized protein